MFKPIETSSKAFESDNESKIAIHIDGETVEASQGMTVASVLLLHGHSAVRLSPINGAPRGPYCLMGVCFECLLNVNGMPNQRACQVIVEPDMIVTTSVFQTDE